MKGFPLLLKALRVAVIGVLLIVSLTACGRSKSLKISMDANGLVTVTPNIVKLPKDKTEVEVTVSTDITVTDTYPNPGHVNIWRDGQPFLDVQLNRKQKPVKTGDHLTHTDTAKFTAGTYTLDLDGAKLPPTFSVTAS